MPTWGGAVEFDGEHRVSAAEIALRFLHARFLHLHLPHAGADCSVWDQCMSVNSQRLWYAAVLQVRCAHCIRVATAVRRCRVTS